MSIPVNRSTASRVGGTSRLPVIPSVPSTPEQMAAMTESDWRFIEGQRAPRVDPARRPLVGTRLSNAMRPRPPAR